MSAAERVTLDYIAERFRCSMTMARRVLAHAGGNVRLPEFHAWVAECQRDGIDLAGPLLPKPSRLPQRKGRVYFIEAVGAGRIKIGFTSDRTVDARRRSLQTASPFPLRVIYDFDGSMQDEANLHKRFASHRAVPGTEWFHDAHEIRAHIAWLSEVIA